MSSSTATIPPAKALQLHSLITLTELGIASRVLAKTSGGNLTLFAFDAGQGLAEHTSPFDALVLVLEGTLTLTIGGTAVRATPGTIVRMPADVAHAVDAPEVARMLLIMLRDHTAGGA
jgi:quercetin dioxygenase-like cupin family protein